MEYWSHLEFCPCHGHFHSILVPEDQYSMKKWITGPSFYEKIGLPDQYSMENWSPPGPIFHGKLVHCRTKIFSIGPIFHEKIGPGDQNSMENWSPGPIFSRTKIFVTGILARFRCILCWQIMHRDQSRSIY